MIKKILYTIIICIILEIGVFFVTKNLWKNEYVQKNSNINNTTQDPKVYSEYVESSKQQDEVKKKKINDWRLILVNYQNYLLENYVVNLSYIDNTRQFDSRAIAELKAMLKDMKNAKLNIWVQSSYRSIEYQEKLFNNKIKYYMEKGKTREQAEELTLQTINRPRTSEHNLGLAIDFNYVNNDFGNTKEFKWLQENAENYGFILRYRKDKEDVTKVNYEPWHWRYVGVDNAKKINELNMCLEEYIDYLQNN